MLLGGVAASTLAACGGGEEAAERAAEKAAEDSSGGDVDVEIDGDEVEIETDEGTMSVGQDLPEGFPEEIPLVEGEIVSGASVEGKGWTVSVQTDFATAKEAVAAARDELGGGWTASGEMDNPSMSLVGLAKGAYQLSLMSTAGDGGAIVLYTVAIEEP